MYFKELPASKSKICRGILQARDSGKSNVAVLTLKVEDSGSFSMLLSTCRIPSSLENFSLLIMPSIDWVKPTHIMGSDLLYLKSLESRC